ncbi:DUF4268 domain-containing protein [Carboxylicivirga sediminis]|uniref:DUF4268 domain-containing protein n=1 Tax=Carboxylicivirga sediminis TaxID=2006564 RepID=A0A941IX39_9BACT|nr:DUF4268 domain-containing protein [Carboxylicivirga sediminis]MBR8535004.1 DUF4268 domain-containing protein [Carboxylicivirga sediminis]
MFSKEEAKQIRQLFWHKLENRTRRIPGQKGKKIKWLFDDTGIKGVDLRFDINRERAIVALEINHRSEERRLKLYEKLEACKSIFESTYGGTLEWDYLYTKDEGRDVCRVYEELAPADLYQQEQWPDVMKFMIDRMIRLEKAFLEVKDFLLHDELGQ